MEDGPSLRPIPFARLPVLCTSIRSWSSGPLCRRMDQWLLADSVCEQCGTTEAVAYTPHPVSGNLICNNCALTALLDAEKPGTEAEGHGKAVNAVQTPHPPCRAVVALCATCCKGQAQEGLPEPFVIDGPLNVCTGCRAAYYCGAACQQAAWKLHKGYCKAFASKGLVACVELTSVTDCRSRLRRGTRIAGAVPTLPHGAGGRGGGKPGHESQGGRHPVAHHPGVHRVTVSARRGWGAQQATVGPLQRGSVVRTRTGGAAPSVPPPGPRVSGFPGGGRDHPQNPGFPRNPSLAPLPLLSQCTILVYSRALPPVRWKLSFTVPCQEGNAVRETTHKTGVGRT